MGGGGGLVARGRGGRSLIENAVRPLADELYRQFRTAGIASLRLDQRVGLDLARAVASGTMMGGMGRALRSPVPPTNAVTASRARRPTAPVGKHAVLIADAAHLAKFQPVRLETLSHGAESARLVLIGGDVDTEDI